MVFFQNKLKHLAITVLFLAIFSILPKAQAIVAPQVYFTELDIAKNNFSPGERIEGTVSLWNYEQFLISDLVFHFQLLGKEVNGVPVQMIDEQKDQETFSISAGQKIARSFSYLLPANLPTGSFMFRIQLANSRGEEMGWIDGVITIGGEGKFLTLDNYWIVKDGKELPPGGGVNYQSGEIPQICFDVTNDTNFTLVAFPKIITYKRNIGEKVIRTQQESDALLEPGQQKTILVNLPQLYQPESYLSEVRLYLKDTQEPISNSISFRWIIEGEDDAEILSVSTDKESYQAGEKAEVRVQFTGPAHTKAEEEEPEPGELEIKLYDEEGQLVGKKKEEVQLKSGQALVSIPLDRQVNNPRIETAIAKRENVLDKYAFQVKPVKEEEVAEEEVAEEEVAEEGVGFFEKNKKIMVAILTIVIIIVLVIYFGILRKKKAVKTLILLTLIGLATLFATANALAATEVADSPCNTTIVFNSPLPDETYNPGDVVHFSGKFKVTNCADGLFHNKVEFFITADRDIPLLRRNCCDDCCGASSQVYGGCVRNLTWCKDVKIVDYNQSDVRKLGTIYPFDVASGAKPYWVEYNEYFTIPSDLEFSGPIRFYVQYSGTHWRSHWHWNIAYQKGYLNRSPIASISCEPSCTAYKGSSLALKNDSYDPDIQIEDRIVKSEWDILDWGTGPDLRCDGLCDFTLQTNILPAGNYTVKLHVEDKKGFSSTTTQDFYLLLDASAGFMCSLSLEDPQWKICEDLKPFREERVYFKDDPSLPEHSTPSEGATSIVRRTWKINGSTFVSEENNPDSSINLNEASNIIELEITDDRDRTASVSHTISTTIPLPEWREIPPF